MGAVQVSEKIGGGVVVRELSQLCSHALASMMVSLSSLYYCLAVLSLCRYMHPHLDITSVCVDARVKLTLFSDSGAALRQRTLKILLRSSEKF